MPSGAILEIDAADNDVAILDSSVIALAAASSAGSSVPKEHTVSQSQNDVNDEEEEAATAPMQVSPMPKASVVTPRTIRRKTGGKKAKASAKKGGNADSGNNSPATPPAKSNANANRPAGVAVATPPGENSAKKGKSKDAAAKKPAKTLHSFFSKAGSSAKKSKATTTTKLKSSGIKASSSAKAKAAPVASAPEKETSKKTTEPPAQAVEKSKPKEATKVTEKPASKEATNIKAKTKKAPKKPQGEKAAEKPAANPAKTPVKKANPAKTPVKKANPAKTPVKKATKKAAASPDMPKTKVVRTPPKSKAKSKVKSSAPQDTTDLDDSPMFAVMMASQKMRGGRRRKSGGSVLEKLPTAIAAVGGAKEVTKDDVEVVDMSCDDKSVDTVVTKATDSSSNYVVDLVDDSNVSGNTMELAEEAVQVVDNMSSDDCANAAESSAGDAINKDEEINGPIAVDMQDPAEQVTDAMDVYEHEAVEKGDETTITKSSDVIDVDCEEETTSAPEEKVADLASKDADSDDDATVAMEEEDTSEIAASSNDVVVEQDSDVPAEISQSVDTGESSEKQNDPSADEEVVVVDTTEKSVLAEGPTKENDAEVSSNDQAMEIDAPTEVEVTKMSVIDQLPGEENVKEALDDEVAIIETLQVSAKKSIQSKRKSAKIAPKSRKRAAAASKKVLKSKKTTASATEKKKEKVISPIAASLKKLAAQPAKKSKATPEAAKKQEDSEQPKGDNASSTTASAVSKDIAESSAKLTAKKVVTKAKKLSAKPASKQDVTTAAVTHVIAKLSEDDAARLKHYTGLREKYVARALELGERPNSDDFEEESLSLEKAEGLTSLEKGSVEVGEDGEFPDKLLTHLLVIVQGRSLPLSTMSKQALDQLTPYITDSRPLTIDSISSKVKLLAQRKSCLAGKPPAPSEKAVLISKLDCFENAEECYMWRWELASVDLLPQKEAAKVKKARTMRKKLQGHYKAIMNLIAAIDKAVTWLNNSASKSSIKAAGDKLIAKVSDMEEKVLKFEREEEKVRLLKEAKLQKQKHVAVGQAEKQKEKERFEQERVAEKKRKDGEKELKKLEAAKERDEAKRKKNEEKEQEKLKKQQEAEEKETKRKARLMSFFGGGKKKKQKVICSGTKQAAKASPPSFDCEAFRKQIDSQDEHIVSNPFAKLSNRSKQSRRRKTAYVRVSVFVTVVSENAFAPQPYDEERIITVPNRYKFLGFHEDVRPPYRGTWSKRSKVVTGRRPYGKDTKYMDYENDSEAEWEEGDDEEGEDLQDGDDGVDEEDDMQDEDNDGFIAAEDDLGIEDEDDATRELRKKNLSEANSRSGRPSHFKACVVAPRMGGLSHENFSNDMQCVIEGFSSQNAMDALMSHVSCIVTPDASVCLDAFPPSDATKCTNRTKKDSIAQNKEMSTEAQQIMAKFVHNSTHTSKEIVVTELLKAHPTVTNSRAQAVRELDVIAEKRRLANGAGMLWEVKKDHLKKLGLKKKDIKKPPKEATPASDGADKKSKEKKDPNAPKRFMSAYIIYSSATRADVRTTNPEAQFGEIAQIISKNYKALTSEERACWDKKAAEDKERYQKEMLEHSAKTTASTDDKAANDVSLKPPSPQQATKKPSLANKKRKKSNVSKASANLFASFLGKKKQKTV